MNTSNKIIVVIPCYNCASTITNIIRESLMFVDEVVVIDDGSSDNSQDFADVPGAYIFRNQKNQGVGYALKTGFEIALYRGAKYIISLDADGAHDTGDIPTIIDTHIRQNNMLTIGDRWSQGPSNDIPSTKYWANQFANQLLSNCIGKEIKDAACGFRVYQPELVKLLFKSINNRFDFMYDMLFMTNEAGKIGYSPISVRYDASELLLTKQKELLDMLNVCVSKNTKCLESYKNNVIEVIRKAKHLEKFTISFFDKFSNIITVIAIPVISHNGYIFQKQNSYFVDILDSNKDTIFFNQHY